MQAHIIHMLIVAINTDTQLTLLLFILLPLVCTLDLGLALHADIDVEDGSCNYAKEEEDSRPNNKPSLFAHTNIEV